MPKSGLFIRAWRLSQHRSQDDLASKAGIPLSTLEALEGDDHDPHVSTIEAVACALGIPTAWLYADPTEFDLLFEDDEEKDAVRPSGFWQVDPVLARIRRGSERSRFLYVLLTALLEKGDPKLVRAAEVNLKSLLKQCRETALPWQTRSPGNFEPPSD